MVNDEGRQAVQLTANQGVRVEPDANRHVAVISELGRPGSFITGMPKPTSARQTLAGVMPRYRLTDLGTLGGDTSNAYSLNALGQVVGASQTSSGTTMPFFTTTARCKTWRPRPLGYVAVNINADGRITGFVETTGEELHVFLYDAGGMKKASARLAARRVAVSASTPRVKSPGVRPPATARCTPSSATTGRS